MERHLARVITCSDSAAAGRRVDVSGPAVRSLLEARGFDVDSVVVAPDSIVEIARALLDAVDRDGVRLVVTTGGTGIAPTDVTPEAAAQVMDRTIPGFGERMRAESLTKTAMAPLSRAQAGVRGRALIVNVPGSAKAAVENLEAILPLVPHALELLGGTHVEKHPGA